MVKNLSKMRETWVWPLGWEDPLEKGMATHSSILGHGQKSLVDYSPWSHKESDTTERLTLNTSLIWKIMLQCNYQYGLQNMGFPGGSVSKESACNAGDLGSVLGLGRSPEKKEMATHSSILAWEILIARGVWQATVHGVIKNYAWLSD